MDRGEHQVVLIEQRWARLRAGQFGRIERERGQEPLSGGILRSDLLELIQVGDPRPRRVIQTLELGLVPFPKPADLAWPGGAGASQRGNELAERLPGSPRARPRGEILQPIWSPPPNLAVIHCAP